MGQSTADTTSTDVVGQYANQFGNYRGVLLNSWATEEKLTLVNTCFRKRWGKRWTHITHGRKRQIDYVLVDRHLRTHVLDAEVCSRLDLGSDHRAVKVILKINCKMKSYKYKAEHVPVVGWVPKNIEQYEKDLDLKLHDLRAAVLLENRSESLENKLSELESAVAQTAKLHQKIERVVKRSVVTTETKELIDKRRMNSGLSPSERADISKKIQRQLRQSLRRNQNEQVAQKIEAFRDLKSIAAIRKHNKRKHISSVIHKDGHVQNCRQGIVDVFADFYADLYSSSLVRPGSALELNEVEE